MRVNLKDLERAESNPGAYLDEETSSGSKFHPKSKHPALLLAINYYHKKYDNLAAGLAYLEAFWDKRFKKNPVSLKFYIDQLTTYASEYRKLGYDHIKTRDNLILSLPEEFEGKIEVFGQVARLDSTPDGYAVWLFQKRTMDWREELRFPLIQEAYASRFSAELDEVTVGVYDFSTASYTQLSFTEEQVEKAKGRLHQLLRKLIWLESLRIEKT